MIEIEKRTLNLSKGILILFIKLQLAPNSEINSTFMTRNGMQHILNALAIVIIANVFDGIQICLLGMHTSILHLCHTVQQYVLFLHFCKV